MNAKKCKGTRISIEHYFLPNPNGGVQTKWAENLGYCSVCFDGIGLERPYAIKTRFGQNRNTHANKQYCGSDTL